MQPDPNEHPVVGSDHQLSASTETTKPQNKGIRAIVWIALLVFFAAGFFLVLRSHDTGQKTGPGGGGGGGRRGGAGGGPVVVTSATAKKGNIGVFVDAIGTVTPVYTASITSQVNGIVTEVHFTEGQLVRKGDPLIEIDSRPYRATLMQAQGVLERDQGILAQAEMDLDRYQKAWARNAIPKQTLDDQEKVVEQVKGTVKNDQGVVQYNQIQVDFLPYCFTHYWTSRPKAGRSRQCSSSKRERGPGGRHPDSTDHGGLYDCRGSPGSAAASVEGTREASGGRV